jgi:hypothetical protein
MQDGADDLPDHPQNGDAGEQGQLHDQCFLPIAVQESAPRERHGGLLLHGRLSPRGFRRILRWEPVCPRPSALIVLCCQSRTTFQGGWWIRPIATPASFVTRCSG